MRIEIFHHSDVGRVRDHNEDCVDGDDSFGLVVLADGMGGYQAGEVASAIAVETIMREMSSQINNLPESSHDPHQHERASILLEQAVLKANLAVYVMAEREPHYRGMGTTIVAALFRHGFVSIAHVGDSRLYRYRQGGLTQLTTDHSVVQELIDCGFCTPEQRPYFPNKNLVTRALGVGETVVVDVQQQAVSPGDIYLLCSDGLNDMLDDKSIAMLLRNNNQSLKQAAFGLVEAANARGGEDNISVVLTRILPSELETHNPHWLERWFGRWLRRT